MKTLYNTIYICILIPIILVNVYSQQKKDTLEYQYPFEILITAPRLHMPLRESPFATSIVDSSILNTMPRSISVDEALRLIPGLKVDNQADGERVHLSIRGQGILSERGIRGIKVLLDGIPLNDPTGFTPDFYDVDWPAVDLIEVLRGPAASLYGGSSSSGVINILSDDARNMAISGKVFLLSGTFNTWKGYGQVGSEWKNGNARLSFSREMGDGYRVHTHFQSNKLYGKLKWSVSPKVLLTPVFGYVKFYNENAEGLNRDQVTEDPRQPNGDAIPKHEFIETERYMGGLTGAVEITKQQSLLFTGFIRHTDYTESVPSQVISRILNAPGISLQYVWNIGKKPFVNQLSAGVDYQYQTIDATSHPNLGGAVEGPELLADSDIKQSGLGLYLLDRIELGSKWAALLSLRFDKMMNKLDDNLKNPNDLSGTMEFSKGTGGIGVTYILNKEINLYSNWGMGFLPPATEELIANPNDFGGFNENLTYATSQGPEAGMRGFFGRKLYFDLCVYYLQTKNDFDRFRVSSRPYETFYKNSGESRRFGVEFYTDIKPIQLIDLKFAYTYSNFKYTNEDPIKIIMDDTTIHKFIEKGNLLPNSPEHQFVVDLQLNLTNDLSIGFGSETYSRSYIDGANLLVESVGGYTLYGMRAAYRTMFSGTRIEVSVNAKNIFSRRYIAFTEPDPGGNSYQPGTPIQVFLNANLGF